MKPRRRRIFGPAVLVLLTVVGASGACSQHAPGPYEGGGRDIPTSVVGDIGEGPAQPDASLPNEASVPDVGGQDALQLPDVGGQG